MANMVEYPPLAIVVTVVSLLVRESELCFFFVFVNYTLFDGGTSFFFNVFFGRRKVGVVK